MNEFDEIKIYCKENDVVSVSQLLKYARQHNEKWISWISRKPDNFWEVKKFMVTLKKERFLRWRQENPIGTPLDCIADTELSKELIRKWWTNIN